MSKAGMATNGRIAEQLNGNPWRTGH